MTQELRKLADDLDAEFAQGRISNHNGRKAAAEIRVLLDRLEKAEKDAECFLLWVHEAWHSPSDIMKLMNNCETPDDYRAKLLPIIAAKKAAITGAMEASK